MTVIDRSAAIFELASKLRQVGRLQIGRIFGTVGNHMGRYQAMIDLLERCYFMRAELNAIAAALIEKKVLTPAEWARLYEAELTKYFTEVAKAWPEIRFDAHGYTIHDIEAFHARAKREEWPP